MRTWTTMVVGLALVAAACSRDDAAPERRASEERAEPRTEILSAQAEPCSPGAYVHPRGRLTQGVTLYNGPDRAPMGRIVTAPTPHAFPTGDTAIAIQVVQPPRDTFWIHEVEVMSPEWSVSCDDSAVVRQGQ